MARRSPDSERLSDTDPLVARRRKLEALEALGTTAFPHAYRPTDTAADLLAAFDDGAVLPRGRVGGRIVSLRGHGRSTFLHLEDRTGRIQVYLKRDELGDAYDLVESLDLGDFLGVEGELFRTRTGEVTLRAGEVRLLAKALRGLPLGKELEEDGGRRTWHRASDPEFRYRQRYADLAIRPEARAVFVERARVIRYMREFLEAHGFLEVETPVLQPVYGGAAARPFETFHHALGVPMYLRIADELYLKRCIVGGIDRVYEISKDFRNEGIDRFHNPEFTMLEFYQAYADYHDFMRLTEELLEGLVRRITGGTELTYQGRTVDVRPPWPRLRFLDALAERGVPADELDRDRLAAEARRRGIEVGPADGMSRILDLLFARIVEPDLEGPIFVLDHPAELSPLAKRHRDDARLVERFEPYLFGREIGNAFTELNDPRDQRARLEALAEAAARGDLEAPATVDEDFLRALEYGMPPTAGMGIGIDRLVMFLTDQPSIRDVILFPILRPEEGRTTAGEDEE